MHTLRDHRLWNKILIACEEEILLIEIKEGGIVNHRHMAQCHLSMQHRNYAECSECFNDFI